MKRLTDRDVTRCKRCGGWTLTAKPVCPTCCIGSHPEYRVDPLDGALHCVRCGHAPTAEVECSTTTTPQVPATLWA